MLRRKDTLKPWKIMEEWATDGEKWKYICKTHYPAQVGERGNMRERNHEEYLFALV